MRRSVKVYNSLTRKKEEFIPIKKGRVGIYACGPTVYDEPHIGHGRSAYIFDYIRRYLEYKSFKVRFVRNVTDVDDKIIEKSREGNRVTGNGIRLKEKVKEIAKKYLDAYHDDMALLGIREPDKEPKATEYIPKMIKFIKRLINSGNAYVSGGDVYFDIRKARSYGKLSNQNLEKMEAGARIASGENKKDRLDFALWKKAKADEPSWKSPWGEGRPGWHIECSVMSSNILGDEFDIHGGGIDLIFPHHENEIAQSEGAGKKFARYWMHNGLLTISGEKMAKSLGNFITLKDFLTRHKDSDYLKLFFLPCHYRSPIDYTDEKIEEAKKEKDRFQILLEKMERILEVKKVLSSPKNYSSSGVEKINFSARSNNKEGHDPESFRKQFEEAMDDDFNTPLALAALFDLVTYANKFIAGKEAITGNDKKTLFSIKKMLLDLSSIFGLNLLKSAVEISLSVKDIKQLIDKRNEARNKKDFKTADEIRKMLLEKHDIVLEDMKDETLWRKRV